MLKGGQIDVQVADQDPTGAAPARLAQATAMLRGNLRMLADMLTSPPPSVAADAPSRGDRQRRSAAARTASNRPHPTAATWQPQRRRQSVAAHEPHRHLESSDRHGMPAGADVTIA